MLNCIRLNTNDATKKVLVTYIFKQNWSIIEIQKLMKRRTLKAANRSYAESVVYISEAFPLVPLKASKKKQVHNSFLFRKVL